jgi:hypothetical protein
MAKVIARNATKSRDGAARVLAISNAHEPGEDSDAEHDYEAWQAIEQGKSRATGFLYDSLEAPPDVELADELQLRAGAPRRARRLDLARRSTATSRRSTTRATALDVAAVLPEPDRRGRGRVDRAARVGSLAISSSLAEAKVDRAGRVRRERSRSASTGRRPTTTRPDGLPRLDGYVFTLGVWDPADYDGEAPRELIDDVVQSTFECFDVSRSSPTCTRSSRTSTSGRSFGGKRLKVKASRSTPIAWDMRGRQKDTTIEIERLHDEIVEKAFRHDGNPRVGSTSTTRAGGRTTGASPSARSTASRRARSTRSRRRCSRAWRGGSRSRSRGSRRPARPCSSSPGGELECSHPDRQSSRSRPPRLPLAERASSNVVRRYWKGASASRR